MKKILLIIAIAFTGFNANSQTLKDRYPAPEGFVRVQTDAWGNYLRNYPVYPEDHICKNYRGEDLYDEPNHGAVLKLPLVKGDLQQCADACMRLRCEFLHENNLDDKIQFHDTKGNLIPMQSDFTRYLIRLFSYANSYSLEKFDTYPIEFPKIRIGDLFCFGGFPGHVVIIMDVAKDKEGNIAFLCAQSWMPAQEMEIVPATDKCAWYIIQKRDQNDPLLGIGIGLYTFDLKKLRTWKQN